MTGHIQNGKSWSYLWVAAALPASEARVCPVVGLAHVAVLSGHAPVVAGKDVIAINLRRSAKVDAPGCVNAAGKLGQK